MSRVFKYMYIEYMNGGVLKISVVRLYPKVGDETPPEGTTDKKVDVKRLL
jgi:hypothetical protein